MPSLFALLLYKDVVQSKLRRVKSNRENNLLENIPVNCKGLGLSYLNAEEPYDLG